MTLFVAESDLTIDFSLNIPNATQSVVGDWVFTLISQYSVQPEPLVADLVFTNARYSTFRVTFPTGFGDAHKNGIYNWNIKKNTVIQEAGLTKVVTDPGGGLGTTSFDSGVETENRVADVFYRPNY
jgi:hypothetical protein